MAIMAEYEPRPVQIFPEHALAHRYLDGIDGIEIGAAAHNPFNIPNCRTVDNTDSMETVFKAQEIRLCGRAARVDIVGEADALPLESSSIGYVLSSHVLEHVWDVVGCLIEWARVLRVGGLVFAIIPRPTALREDIGRPLTTISELRTRHDERTRPGPDAPAWGHFNVWDLDTFRSTLRTVLPMYGIPLEVIDSEEIDTKVGNGFTIVLRKSA